MRRLALGQLHQRRIGEHGADRPVFGARCSLAPGGKLMCHGARPGVELIDARQPLPGCLGIALVGGRLQPPALLDRPSEPAGVAEATLELVG